MSVDIPLYLLSAVAGTLLGALVSFIPGLHAYNLAGFAVLAYLVFPFDPLVMAMFMLGMVVGYAIISNLGSVYFSTPDDGVLFTVLPSQKYLLQGRGHEAAVLLGMGALTALFITAAVSPFISQPLSMLRRLLTPHLWWVLGLVILYMVQSEWPKDYGSRAKTRLGRLKDGWSTPMAGIITLLLSGLLGIILTNRSIVPIDRAFQNIMPVFVGLFAIPWLLTNLISRVSIPKQHVTSDICASKVDVARGAFTGTLGGWFAGYTPIVTAGIGSFLAGHATTTRGDAQFTLSYGAARFAYYVGAFLLLWLPFVHLARGGMGWIASVVYSPKEEWEFWLAAGAMVIAGLVAFGLLVVMSRALMKVAQGTFYKKVSAVILGVLLVIVYLMTSWEGLVLMVVATGIGMIPVMFRCRRTNCMGVLLIPIFLNMLGWGPRIVEALGLV